MAAQEIPPQHDIGRRAHHAVEGQLQPSIATRLGEGDDYGLDAFVQHVLPGRPARRTTHIFGLQVKGHESPLSASHTEALRVSHLKSWTQSNLPTLIAIHSVATGETRWRFAADVVRTLDATHSSWRRQATVSVAFEPTACRLGADLHAWLGQQIDSFTDPLGGRVRTHSAVRSVLLTEFYHGYFYSGQRGGLATAPRGSSIAHWISGVQWSEGEFSESDVVASRVLTGALLLFDEVYFPAYLTYAAVGALGPRAFIRLIKERRLIPVAARDRDLAFVVGDDQLGDLYFFDTDMMAALAREVSAVAERHSLQHDFDSAVLAATMHVDYDLAVVREVDALSKLPYLRDLLALGAPRPQAKECEWSAIRLLRIGNVVKHYAAAAQLGVDVVEFEPGLARLALARWGSSLQFHRVYQALDELHRALEAAALPDLGRLVEVLGIERCIEISDGPDGASFRRWFWDAAADSLRATGSFEGDIARQLLGSSNASLPFPSDFLVALSAPLGDEGIASRPGGEASLARQRRVRAQQVGIDLLTRYGKVPEVVAPCPCGSEAAFGSCCGRILQDV